MLRTWLTKWKRPLVAVCALAVIGGSGWFLYTKGPLGPPKVTVAKAHKENLKPAVFGIGTVEARLAYTVGPTQAGRVLSVLADHGDVVQAGQVLGEIDPVDLNPKVQSAAAAVAKAQSSVAVSEAQVRDTYSRNALAQTNAKRYNDLLAAQAISAELADSKQNEANAAQAAYESAQASLAAAREEVARAASDQNALVSQRTNLQLVSPVNGIIVSRDAEPGTTVVAGQSVFHLVDPATLWVRTRIDQSRFYGIAIGQPASIVLRSRQTAPLVGKVARLEVQGDNVTEERFVDVMFSDLAGLIPLGELAEVTIDLPPVTDALVVPTAAVKRIDKQNGVWIVDNGHLRFQPVTIGAQTLDGQTQIIDGLNPGDAVVIYSPKQLTDGMSVRVEKKP
ncbi:efflux RND transporter periplasmic adaptor subunit [Sporomusa acidovorans]|uniref:Macrolide export protein MacA n=1 Tax=Sporomusa acidovorans (strain ATCC 49682 / DSM 3132 / Mol) TaxID=1123286 RepID=A0ABZ3IYU2_SPOA4|nr:efflux RND transporter periplasmic adaptor subunit [Sporomusa acidovorans]OZC17707.1 macrolide export protein MacA [Sporomusa acidovorans DSM 3132]SDE12622.1 RND family efflux transporter, MFP subunit [Sporomusa acidovorans]